ncbi:glycosyltransferase family 1 protein [Marinicella sp. S1101]|uniref:glycosyltransferase family 4 protein n=1 Tax=Marinicella marina TaxID=2996016 RepID=UPI0022609A43|nr:glycosyltransferase family 1 protein [Marinicella marina]MCX7552953.1 glycosyltransferase family 1 protein [Marinicella marina]MDJ1139737.1 glycosyltransferase family 1 protein [Marinicella marina]
MDKNLKILVDGFNLGLKKGSGIKTYGMTLLDAYELLGHDVGVLLDNQYVSGKDALIDEVTLFDQEEVRPQSMFNYQWLRNLKAISYLFRKRKGNLVVPKITEPDPENYLSHVGGVKYNYIENIGDVFHIANRLFAATKKITNIKPKNNIDVFHLTTPWPLKVHGAKTVVTIHDLIPLKVPFTTLDLKEHFYQLFKWAAESSDLILSVSEHTKKDIMEIYGVPEEKIKVTYQSFKGADIEVNQNDAAVYLESKKLTAQKYILFVGNIEPKKNIKQLIRAFAYIKKGYKLAIVGHKAWMSDSQLVGLKSYLKKKEYVMLDYVTEEELAMLYSNAFCMVFPSLYEGFGLPVLEAMQNNCPVICSNVSSLPEVGGDAALYVDPYKFTDIREQLDKLIENPDLRLEMIKKGQQRVEFFSPENYAKRLQEAYEGLV